MRGFPFRSAGDPILYINNPDCFSRFAEDAARRASEVERVEFWQVGDPETQTRIRQFEMAFRMQASVPELTNVGQEPESTYRLYGEEARKPGTYAYTCLLARRLVERARVLSKCTSTTGITTATLAAGFRCSARTWTRPPFGLIKDLKSRGLLDDTLIIWGGEFGRTIYSQGAFRRRTTDATTIRAVSPWDGGWRREGRDGVRGDRRFLLQHRRESRPRPGLRHDPPPAGDPHDQFTYKYQGLDQRLTGVEEPGSSVNSWPDLVWRDPGPHTASATTRAIAGIAAPGGARRAEGPCCARPLEEFPDWVVSAGRDEWRWVPEEIPPVAPGPRRGWNPEGFRRAMRCGVSVRNPLDGRSRRGGSPPASWPDPRGQPRLPIAIRSRMTRRVRRPTSWERSGTN